MYIKLEGLCKSEINGELNSILKIQYLVEFFSLVVLFFTEQILKSSLESPSSDHPLNHQIRPWQSCNFSWG